MRPQNPPAPRPRHPAQPPGPAPAAAAEGAGRRRAVLAGLSLGYFAVLLDTTVLAVAEPDLVRDLGASTGALQWVVNGYTVALAACLLSAGAVTDRFGAGRVFRGGIAAFGVLSLLAAAAPDAAALTVLRVLLGVAAAGCVPSSMAVIARAYPDAAERARAIALWAAASGAALAAGPPVGGLLVALGGWRAVFVLNAPLALVVLALVAGPGLRTPVRRRRIDVRAQGCAAAALALATGTLIAAGGAGPAVPLALGAATVLMIAATVLADRRSAAPAFPRDLVRARGVLPALGAGAAVNFALTGVLFALPLLLTGDRGLTFAQTGLVLLALTLPCAVNPLLTGRIVARRGPRGPVLGGLVLLAAGGAVLAGSAAAGLPVPGTVAGLVVCGFGVSFTLPALAAAAVAAAPAGTAGTAAGLLNSARQLGAAFGVAAMGPLVSAPGGGAAAFAAVALVAALAAAANARR